MKFRKKQRESSQINLTPLIDVVFLLLIFFMVSTSFVKDGQLNINLPETSDSNIFVETEQLRLSVAKNGNYAINGQVLVNSSQNELSQQLLKAANGDFSQALTIAADAQAEHRAVVTAMDVAGNLGFKNLKIATVQQASNSN